MENGNVKLNTLIRSLDVMVNKCGIMKIVKFQGKIYVLKNSLIHDKTTYIQHQEFQEKVQSYKKLVIKTKQIYTKQYHKEIRSLKSRNPKEFWKIIQTECKQNSNGISSLISTGFIDHFHESNNDLRFFGYKPQSNTSLVPENDVINHPFYPARNKSSNKTVEKQ